ncbi:hypothetical protein [Krasilnikovia cinnamomea]|uniref:hypothetical protein n=1 Tax=Krasilnikovia cinnamomea TaxID=349313 RepID=UPI001F5FBE08|nr:hypothetical protein [Krasilnikovia cinnamomea]
MDPVAGSACRTHVRLLAPRPVLPGQLSMLDVDPVPPSLRAPYDTGQQEPCGPCAAAGLDRRGVSRDGPGSPPLCLSCWGRRQRSAPRRSSLTPEEASWVAQLAEQLACEACRPQTPTTVDLPPTAVQERRHWRRLQQARGRDRSRRPSPPRRTGCWRCADAAWIAAARAVHHDDQAQAGAEAARVDELRVVHRAALRRVARAQRRLGYVQTWRDRVAGVVEAMPRLTKTGPRGRLQMRQGPGGQGRAVWLVADFLARMADDRARRGLSSRGRPPQHPLVVAVMAIAADPAAGQRSMAGLGPTALFAACTPKTVTTSWAYSVQVGATVRDEVGRTCGLAEREETGLRRRRSVYHFTPLQESPFDPTPFLPAAATVVARLLQRAVELVDERQAVLDAALREATAAEAAVLEAEAVVAERTAEDLQLQAAVSDHFADDAYKAFKAALAVRERATRLVRDAGMVRSAQDTDRMAVLRAGLSSVETAFEVASRMTNFYDPPRTGSRRGSSSGLRGLTFSTRTTSPIAGTRRPHGRGEEHNGGASRPAPTKTAAQPTGSTRPRTAYRVSATSPANLRRSAVMAWAKPLARALSGRWEFLQRFISDAAADCRDERRATRARGLALRQIADTLGTRLGPGWTAADVVRLVERHGLTGRYAEVRTVIAAGDVHSPLSYLARTLDRALTSPAAVVPHHSPVRERYERQVLDAELVAAAASTAALRDELDQRDAAAAAARTSDQSGRHAARAVAGAASRSTAPRPNRCSDPVDAERMAQARAELASRVPVAVDECEWPPTRQPGEGFPSDLRREDR